MYMQLGNKTLELPLIQGGMGVGVSLSGLAGAVAAEGGMGVISSANIGFDEPDFLERPHEANIRALKKHIIRAKELSGGRGLIGVNIMTAVTGYAEACRAAIEAGADAIISGAGLPLKLSEYIGNSDTLFAPIVSSGKAAALLCRSYMRHGGRLPDFFVMEGSGAGGHLGFSQEELLNGTAKPNTELVREVTAAAAPYREAKGSDIPVFAAGGVYDADDCRQMLEAGASGVQIGTRFIATEECDASQVFKDVLINCSADDIMIIKSPVGMPARAVRTPLLEKLAAGEQFRAKLCNRCLNACPGPAEAVYCISRALIAAVRGDYEEGLFFCGSNAARLDGMTTVHELCGEFKDCF